MSGRTTPQSPDQISPSQAAPPLADDPVLFPPISQAAATAMGPPLFVPDPQSPLFPHGTPTTSKRKASIDAYDPTALARGSGEDISDPVTQVELNRYVRACHGDKRGSKDERQEWPQSGSLVSPRYQFNEAFVVDLSESG